jgi:hypothetical protein
MGKSFIPIYMNVYSSRCNARVNFLVINKVSFSIKEVPWEFMWSSCHFLPHGPLQLATFRLRSEHGTRNHVTWVCPSSTHGLVYRVWSIMEVDKYKDSEIDLETKKGRF